MIFKIGQRVNVAPLNEEEEAHEIVGTIVRTVAYEGEGVPFYEVLLDQHLHGMDPGSDPNVDVCESDLSLIKG